MDVLIHIILSIQFGKIPYVLTENDAIRDILPNPDIADRVAGVTNERKKPEIRNQNKPYDETLE